MKKHVLTPIKLFLENLAHLDDSAETISLKDTNLLELEAGELPVQKSDAPDQKTEN